MLGAAGAPVAPVTNHYSSLDRLVFKSIYFANIHLIRSIASPNWVINQFIKGQSGRVRVVIIEEQDPSQNFAANFRGKPISLDKTVREIIVVKKPGGASNRANGGIGGFRRALLEIIVGDLTGGI